METPVKDYNLSASPALKRSPQNLGLNDLRASEAFVLTDGCTNEEIVLAMRRTAGQVFAAVQDECEPMITREMTVWGKAAIYMSLFMTEKEHKERVRYLKEHQA
jgi:hypothetical protein